MYSIKSNRTDGPVKFFCRVGFDNLGAGSKRVFMLVDESEKYYYRKEFVFKVTREQGRARWYLNSVLSDIDSKYLEYLAGMHVYFAETLSKGPASYEAQIPGLGANVTHPETQMTYTLSYVIQNLNDQYSWTREAIADWLETLDENPVLNNYKEEYYV